MRSETVATGRTLELLETTLDTAAALDEDTALLAAVELDPAAVALAPEVETTLAPVGDSEIESSARTQPDFAVIAAGQVTCSKETVGLSEPSNQSKRQSQPG